MRRKPNAVGGVLETVAYASDVDAAEAFYKHILGLPVHTREPGKHVFLRCGAGMLLIFHPEHAGNPAQGIPLHGTVGAGHLALRIEPSEIESWRRWLIDHHVAIESELDWPQGGHSIYFRDPAGNSVELATAALWGADKRARSG